MRLVNVKTAEKQSDAMTFKTRDLLIWQKTQTINALRGHLAEYGIVASQGTAHLAKPRVAFDDVDILIPSTVVELSRLLIDHINTLIRQIEDLSKVSSGRLAATIPLVA